MAKKITWYQGCLVQKGSTCGNPEMIAWGMVRYNNNYYLDRTELSN